MIQEISKNLNTFRIQAVFYINLKITGMLEGGSMLTFNNLKFLLSALFNVLNNLITKTETKTSGYWASLGD